MRETRDLQYGADLVDGAVESPNIANALVSICGTKKENVQTFR